jgi:hypothetical protein
VVKTELQNISEAGARTKEIRGKLGDARLRGLSGGCLGSPS